MTCTAVVFTSSPTVSGRAVFFPHFRSCITPPTKPAERPELSTSRSNIGELSTDSVEGFPTPSTAISWKAHEIGPQWTSSSLTGALVTRMAT